MDTTPTEHDEWASAALAQLLAWCIREADFELARWALQLRRER